MKILIVTFVDDNFGDNLIRICFEKILKVVLQNLRINEYDIDTMALKKIKKEKIENADLVFFAGGGLLGLSYLNFFEYLETILQVAEEKDIPVVFSSVGVNNMDSDENDDSLRELLNRKCIKAISVRENEAFFKNYMKESSIPVYKVCDPAVWTCHIYYQNLKSMKVDNEKNVIGLNVVRGGLFKDNKKAWKLADEYQYLNDIRDILEEKDIDYRLYTNGSFLDNNALRYYQKKFDVPEDKIIYINSTSELVKTIASFSSVYAIRMHSSIISYSLGKPCLNIIWNDKIPLFYDNISKRDQAIEIEDWKAEKIYEKMEMISKKEQHPEKEYLMSLYDYLFHTLSNIFHIQNKNKYLFDEVIGYLQEKPISEREDFTDYQIKIEKGEQQYLNRFIELKEREKEIHKREKNLENKKIEIKELKKELTNIQKKAEKQEQQLNRLNDLFVIRAGRKVKRLLHL